MKFAVVLAALAAVVSAVTPPDTSKPASGNPIFTPGLQQQVPAGKPFVITWNPTTAGKISILLLRGPSTNVQPIGTIADSIPNTGSFVWTPSTALENDVTHYGIQIIVEGTGQYQYSTQFGIDNKNPQQPPKPTTSTVVAPTWTGRQPSIPVTRIVTSSSTGTGVAKPTGIVTITTSICPPGTPEPTGKPPGKPPGTGAPVPVPSGTMPPPPPGSTITPPPWHNGAGRVSAGAGAALLALVAAFAL